MDNNRVIRKSNIELLRVLTMLGVLILHYNNKQIGGGMAAVTPSSSNEGVMLFTESASLVAVNVFIIISGYFLINNQKRSFYKPLLLYLQMSVVNILFYFADTIRQSTIFSLKGLVACLAPTNWFINIYIALYFISPFINKAIKEIGAKSQRLLLLILLILFSLEPTMADLINAVIGESNNTTNFISRYGTLYGYSITQFVLMYVIGAMIRLDENAIRHKPTKTYLFVYFATVVADSFWTKWNDVVYEYCNPFLIIGAVCIFVFFLKLRIEDNRIINSLAKGSFSVFLVHRYLLQFYQIAKYVNESLPVYILHLLVTIVSIYLISWLFYLAYNFLSAPLVTVLKRLLKSFDYEIE